MNLYIYCEGQTEESFVKSLLAPHFLNYNIYTIPIICRTKEGPNSIHKGGIVDYTKAVKEIRRLCYQHQQEYVTSFIDYYGLHNLPPITATNNKYSLIASIEQQFMTDVSNNNFIPYISLHEFESLLFSDPNAFSYLSTTAVSMLKKILEDFDNNPEMINNSVTTAPSKRIQNLIANYGKVTDGNMIANSITLNVIRQKCIHFNNWLSILEKI
ncbi:MAG: DUF4276 family protein [Clostridiales bacterium]|nr:DUF4276 family protein [Clostridiales bacterium]